MTPDRLELAEGALFTDMYQLTMAQLYFRQGLHERPAIFDHFFRSYPDYGEHQAGYCVNAGMGWLRDWMSRARFGSEVIERLRQERDPAGRPVFAPDFLRWLGRHGDFDSLTLRGVPEGRVVHANTPLTVVEGPLALAQILETSLLNTLNFQTLVATRAARIRQVAGPGLLMEFGLRRAQGRGGTEATRASLIGGCDFTSNVGASLAMGLPPKGTHAHSMVQAYMALGGSELDAFRAYAETYPDNCLLLVDTIDTLHSGLPHAIQVFEELRRQGHRPVGVRLDSGDLAHLAVQARKALDEAGFPETAIVLSSDLDELTLWQIHTQIREEAPRYGLDSEETIRRLAYGIGTRLVTSHGSPALGGVYKLVAVREGGEWKPALKLSDSAAKVPNPGEKTLWRIYDPRGLATADLVGLRGEDPRSELEHGALELRHPAEDGVYRRLERHEVPAVEPLLEPVPADAGAVPLEELRARSRRDLERLDPGVRRLVNPHVYHVSLTARLWDLKADLVHRFRETRTHVQGGAPGF